MTTEETLSRIRKSALSPRPWPNDPLSDGYSIARRWEHAGLQCVVIQGQRAHLGIATLCGYVKVPQNHPDHGKWYDDVDVHVHGGLTFCQVTTDGEWFGFDTSHLDDEFMGWTVESVAGETENLARQLAKRSDPPAVVNESEQE
jgi:hypothetical protein